MNSISEKLVNNEPYQDEKLPIIKDTAVVLDDSDEDDLKTDSSEESDLEFSLEQGENVEDLIAETLQKLGIPQQIDGAINNLNSR